MSPLSESVSPVIVQLLNCVQFIATPWTAACQTSLSFTIALSLLKLKSIESVMPSNPLILCHPLLLLPSAFPSIGVFSNDLALRIRWPKYWGFSISPSSEYSGLSLLQHYSSKASVLQHSVFSVRVCRLSKLHAVIYPGSSPRRTKSFLSLPSPSLPTEFRVHEARVGVECLHIRHRVCVLGLDSFAQT